MNYTIGQLLLEASKLPPIPQTAQRTLALMHNPEANATRLARIISTDQVLAARVLRWANSAYYGMESQIVTVKQAIVVLGTDTVQELIMSYSLSDQLNRPVSGYDLERGELWHHALGTAIGAKLISKHCCLKIDEEAYFAGLLCDIGKLIFEKLLREADAWQAEKDQDSFLNLERANFGIDHALLGAEIARHWQLPETLVDAIAYHHEPQAASGHPVLVAVVHVADIIMMILGIGIGVDGLRYSLDEKALKRLGMVEDDLIYLVDNVAAQLTESKELFNPG
jgi:putative nucleotidyltransferase with HDIG domain